MLGILGFGTCYVLGYMYYQWYSVLTVVCVCVAIIMTPTRELALQIGKECKKFTKALGLHAVCVYGGTGISEQIAELKKGAEIIVCTPGRMIDMLAANSGESHWFYLELLIHIKRGRSCIAINDWSVRVLNGPITIYYT